MKKSPTIVCYHPSGQAVLATRMHSPEKPSWIVTFHKQRVLEATHVATPDQVRYAIRHLKGAGYQISTRRP